MSAEEIRQVTEERPTPPPKLRRRFLAGALMGGILGSLLAGSLSVYSHVNQRGCGRRLGMVDGLATIGCMTLSCWASV